MAQGVIGRIFYSSIAGYARDIGLTGPDFFTFIKIVSALDEEYVAVAYERMKTEMEKHQK